MKKEHKAGLTVIAFIVLLIIGISDCGGNSTPTGNTSPISGASALASTIASAPSTVTSSPTPAAVATKAKPKPKPKAKAKPRRTAVAATSNAGAPPPQATTAPAAAPSTPSGCSPLTNGGNCYEPGEFCRNSDHGVSGVAGDGKRIICEDNDGWRWEPV
jgi:hypothetical protein